MAIRVGGTVVISDTREIEGLGSPINITLGGTGASTPEGARTALGLSPAATAEITSSSSDKTTNRLLKVGDFGNGISISYDGDLNSLLYSGSVYASASSTNKPTGVTAGFVYTNYLTNSLASQLMISRTPSGKVYFRSLDTTWTSWVELGSLANANTWNLAQTFLSNITLNSSITEKQFTITDGASVVINPLNGGIQLWSLNANRKPTSAGFANGRGVTLMVEDGANRTIDWSNFVTSSISIVGSTSQSFGNSATASFTLPGGLQKGDVVIISIGSDGSTPDLPAGWKDLSSRTSGSEYTRTAFKVMDTVPDTTVSLSGMGTVSAAGLAIAIRGVNPFSLKLAEAAGTSGNPNPPQLVGVENESIILAIGLLDDDNVEGSVTPPAGFTLLQAKQSTTAGQTVMLAYTTVTSGGSYTPGAFGSSGNDEWVALTISLAKQTVRWRGGLAPTLPPNGYGVIDLWMANGVVYGASIGDVP